MVNQAPGTLTESARHDLAREATRVAEWFEQLDAPQGLGLILLSCTPRELWQTHFVQMPMPDHVAFDVRPDIAGLLELVDDYERFAAALVSKSKARIFTVFAGAIRKAWFFETAGTGSQTGRVQELIGRRSSMLVR